MERASVTITKVSAFGSLIVWTWFQLVLFVCFVFEFFCSRFVQKKSCTLHLISANSNLVFWRQNHILHFVDLQLLFTMEGFWRVSRASDVLPTQQVTNSVFAHHVHDVYQISFEFTPVISPSSPVPTTTRKYLFDHNTLLN